MDSGQLSEGSFLLSMHYREPETTTRRAWAGLAASVLLGACGRRKATGFPGYALIATSGESSLAAVDLMSFKLARSIPLNSVPTAVVCGPLRQDQGYVLTPLSGSIHVVDGELRVRRSMRMADKLTAFRVSGDEKWIYAIAAERHELITAEADTLRVVRRTKLAIAPDELDIAQTGQIAMLSNATASVQTVSASGKMTLRQLTGDLRTIRYRQDGQMLLVGNRQTQSLIAFEPQSLQTIAELPLGMRPENVCFSLDGGQAFVSGPGMDAIAIVFPYQMLRVDQTILAGHAPGSMACSEEPKYLFVTSRDGSDLSIVNIDSRHVVGMVQVGLEPRHITVTPDNQYALVLDERSGNVAVVLIPGINSGMKNNRLKTGASLFTIVAAGSRPVDAAVLRVA